MSTTKTTENIVIPPGVKISSEFKCLDSFITFTKPRNSEPLQPLGQAYYADGLLQISTVAFIDANQKIESISVYYDDTLEIPTFYLTYDKPETEVSKFMSYQINFNIKMSDKPEMIESFVWDVDPRTSRGTYTTVQS